MTERLYYLDPYLAQFDARVTRKFDHEGRPAVVLDRTAFYPTGGGQPNDLGKLSGADVLDVIEQGEEVVHVLSHGVEGEVHGEIDWDRRRDHMQQHHGQHILSEAFVRVCSAETAGFHLGKEICSIDLDKSQISKIDIERAETLANMVVFEDRPITISYYSPEEVAKLPIRKPPPAQPRIRIVQVKDFDCSACCGTHPRRTGEVGVVTVVGSEKGKGGMRLHFVCGYRAVAYARRSAQILASIGAKLSCGREEAEKAVDRNLAELLEARKSLAASEKQLAEIRGKELAARGPVVVELFEGRDMKYLQAVANAIVAAGGKAAILGSSGETSSVVLARSASVALDLRPIFKEVLAVIQGKGGGPAHFVQGGGPGKDVRKALALAEEKIRANLGG